MAPSSQGLEPPGKPAPFNASRAGAEAESNADDGMRWVVDFYHHRRALVARNDVDPPSAAAAVVVGRQALLAQHPPPPPRRWPSLFERAERIGGQDGTGWIVYRIAKGDGMRTDAISS
jgi:hypothetical protein